MPATRSKRTDREAKPEVQLLRAAREVFRLKGYDGASVAEIAREARVAERTFYRYFHSKREAAVALRDGLMETMAQAVATAAESRTSLEDRLESLIAASFKVARNNADLYKLAFIGTDETHPELHSESPEHASILRTVLNLFRGAVDAGEMEPMEPQIAARLAIGLLQHVMIEAFVFGDGEESDRLEQGVSALLLNVFIGTRSDERRRLIEAGMQQERQRLARELHDSVTQSLYSSTLFAEAGRRLADAGDLERSKEYFAQLGETSQQALKEMRLLVHQLRPQVLDQEGLVGAIQQRLDAVERRAGVEARLLVDGDAELPDDVEEGLYFIVQEALNNALKHADANSVTVRINSRDGFVEIEVQDNGNGFEISPTGESGGIGLSSMRERAENLGGSLAITSAPGKGTKVNLRLIAGVDSSDLNKTVQEFPDVSR